MAKSLKEQNRLKIWLIIAVNSLFLCIVVQSNAIETASLGLMLKNSSNLLPVGLAFIISTVLNGLLSADVKARLVFLRWKNVLPGHRAFTKYGKTDPRVDLFKIEELYGSSLPTDPNEQNKVWYKFYKTVENKPSVLQVHGDFLLMRDYAGLAVLFIVFYGAAGFYAIPSSRIGFCYLILLIFQYIIVRQAALTYGVRMVTNVLAEKSADVKR